MKGIILLLSMLLFYSMTAQRKNKDSIKTEQLNTVVVTAQYTPTTEKNAVYKVKVINKKTIRAKAITSLTDLLRQELHINFSFNQIFGAGIELSGVSKENIKILIDGVPLIGRVNGILNLNQISLNNIERVEIIEGPVSVFYGTDAIGGIINLITSKKQKKTVKGNISAMYESIETKDINTKIGFKDKKNILKFGAGYLYFNGLNTDNNNIRSLNWSKKRQYYKQFKYLRNIGKFNIHFSSNFSEELIKVLGEVKREKAIDIDYTTQRFDNTLNLQGKLNKNTHLDFTISYLNYDRYDSSYKFIPAANTSTLIEDNTNANYFDTFFTKTQYSKSDKKSNFNYAIGVEYELNYGKGNRILNNKQQVKNISIYTSINYKITNNFEIQPAIRYTYNNIFKNLLSPAFNTKFKINNQNTIRFAYGNGFRSPSIKELYLNWQPTFGPITYTFTGNKNLNLESSHSFNLYYSYRKQFTNSYLSIEPSVSYNKIENLIGLSDMINFERHYINLNKMKSLNFSIQNRLNYKENLQINLGVSFLGRYVEYTNKFNSDTFMFTPSVSTSANYNYSPLKIDFNLFYKYSGKRKGHYIEKISGEDKLVETTRQDFNNLDFIIQKHFLKNRLSVTTGIKNIFDITDIETYNQIGIAHERNNQLLGKYYFLKTNYKF